MRTVAVIAPDFLPSSMPNALRVRLLTENLQEYGWQPVVITTDPQYYEQPADPENLALLRGSYEVVRTRALPPRLTRRFGIGDIGLRTLWFHWQQLSRLCQSRKIDLVFISVPPNYPMLLGRLAYFRFGIPYVVDYQDPYITDYYKTLPPAQRPPKWRMYHALGHLVEPVAIRHVGHIVSVDSSYVAGVISRYHWLASEDVTSVPLGVEPSDFDYVRAHPRPNPIFDPQDGLLHLSYVGRGGPDMLAAAEALFAALRMGSRQSPELFGRMRLHFVGTDYAHAGAERYQFLPLAREMGVDTQVEEHPLRVPYLTALQVLTDSQALMVVGSTASYYTPSKIFPYILARKPLLGIFHENSSVIEILKRTGAGEAVTFGENNLPQTRSNELLAKLRILAASVGETKTVNREEFEPYTARAVTARLAGAFEKALEKSKPRELI